MMRTDVGLDDKRLAGWMPAAGEAVGHSGQGLAGDSESASQRVSAGSVEIRIIGCRLLVTLFLWFRDLVRAGLAARGRGAIGCMSGLGSSSGWEEARCCIDEATRSHG